MTISIAMLVYQRVCHDLFHHEDSDSKHRCSSLDFKHHPVTRQWKNSLLQMMFMDFPTENRGCSMAMFDQRRVNHLSGYPLLNSHKYGKSPLSMKKSTISMAMFNSYVCLPDGANSQTCIGVRLGFHPRRRMFSVHPMLHGSIPKISHEIH